MLVALLGCTPAVSTDSGDSGAPTGTTPPPEPEPSSIQVIGFNTESGGSDPAVVASEVIADMRGEGLWGFSEVQDAAAAAAYVAAAADPDGEQAWDHVLGTTGYSDRLALAWDDARFSLEDHQELSGINVGGTARAPLVGRMRERATDLEFLFVVNHLWRTDEQARHEQAELLHAWGREQTLPVVMVGDYNFDWDVTTGRRDAGYDLLTDGGVFEWVRPDPLLTTQCSGVYDSVLDFVFVGGEAQTWGAESDVLRPDDSYCSGSHRDTWSDHRPVRAIFTVPIP